MAATTIEWTDFTFNPWEGCQKVSPGCDHCYAEARDKRFSGGRLWGPHAARRLTSDANWRKPLAWNRAAAAAGTRARVFCASLADIFDTHASVLPAWRARLWALIRATPHLDWQLLTKRPQNIARLLPEDWGDGWPHVWLGTTAENQPEADRRVPVLLAAPARVRFLSVEPMLGPVNLRHLDNGLRGHANGIDALTGYLGSGMYGDWGPRIDLVICGGESGPGARPMHPDWARSLRDQCVAAKAAFFMKQMGGAPGAEGDNCGCALSRIIRNQRLTCYACGRIFVTREAIDAPKMERRR